MSMTTEQRMALEDAVIDALDAGESADDVRAEVENAIEQFEEDDS